MPADPAAAGASGALPQQARQEQAAAVRACLRARRCRERYLPPEVLGEPGWDMLLDLYAAGLEGKNVSISSACIAASVPSTTALRWLNRLIDRGFISRLEDEADARRTHVRLTEEGSRAVGAWVAMILVGGEFAMRQRATPSEARPVGADRGRDGA